MINHYPKTFLCDDRDGDYHPWGTLLLFVVNNGMYSMFLSLVTSQMTFLKVYGSEPCILFNLCRKLHL